MANSFANALRRLQAAVQPDSNARRGRLGLTEVSVADLHDLLVDWRRLDTEARRNG